MAAKQEFVSRFAKHKDELDTFRIAIYCEQNYSKILRNPSKLPPPV